LIDYAPGNGGKVMGAPALQTKHSVCYDCGGAC
jgi:hypothetical protein